MTMLANDEKIGKYSKQIDNQELIIDMDITLSNIDFVKDLPLSKLTVKSCPNIVLEDIPDNVKELTLINCDTVLNKADHLTKLVWTQSKTSKFEFPSGLKVSTLELFGFTDIDLAAFKVFNSIQELKLGNCQLVDISKLKYLVNVTSLDISCNQIMNISYISSMNKAKRIIANKNQIRYINFVKQFFNLEYLDISDNQIQIIDDLQQCPLLHLNFSHNKVEDFSVLQYFSRLQFLSYQANKQITVVPQRNKRIFIADILQLQDLSTLDISFNYISFERNNNNRQNNYYNEIFDKNCVKFEELHNLKSLFINNIRMHMKLKEIQLLQFPKQLTHLSFNDTKLESVSQFCELEYLLHLEIANNNINNISDLAKLDKLQHLVIRNNKVSDISVLENLLRLKHFDASLNKIADLQVFAENTFESLEYLNLSCNKIDDISALTQYLNNGLIQHVDLSCNQLWDVSNVSLHRNTSIRLCNNYICDYNNLLQSESFQYEFIGAQKVPDSKFIKSKILTGKKVNVAEKREQLICQHNISLCNIQQSYYKYIQSNYIQYLYSEAFIAIDNEYIQDLTLLNNFSCVSITLTNCVNFKFSQIQNITNLTVMQSKISSISGIESMVQLQILDLSENEIRDIYPLHFLINLQQVNLRSNQIIFIDNIFKSSKLENLNVEDNKLSSTGQLPEFIHAYTQRPRSYNEEHIYKINKVNLEIMKMNFVKPNIKQFKARINIYLNCELSKLNKMTLLFVRFFTEW
ncbi:Conserved_hypothetical protein [Hexamita inflata]|uniref:Uncharacterized protein n=1 Tax=Hexamita inflata TaxID=28002 RepID=A0AA86UY01_9EUKA|nr:Conserved hypothetical protein [Hexamita inflata]CAI9969087.1 Conserved hypothetical protein [Hexamita inflata]